MNETSKLQIEQLAMMIASSLAIGRPVRVHLSAGLVDPLIERLRTADLQFHAKATDGTTETIKHVVFSPLKS